MIAAIPLTLSSIQALIAPVTNTVKRVHTKMNELQLVAITMILTVEMSAFHLSLVKSRRRFTSTDCGQAGRVVRKHQIKRAASTATASSR